MEWIDIVIKAATFVAALIALWKIVKAAVKLADNMKETKDYVKDNVKNVESIPIIEQHCKENYLMCLRLTIMSKDMPVGERIAAGIKYLEAGGNGEVKQYLINELHINDVQHN